MTKLRADELMDLLLNKLLRKTSPKGNEKTIIGPYLAQYLPEGIGSWDKEDNFIAQVGEKSETLFCCHMDTVGKDVVKTRPVLLPKSGFIYTYAQKSCLGGDDRCGILCLIALIRAGVPGTYIFHSGEESGCIGARYIEKTLDFSKFKRAVEFDRRGEQSVITQMCSRSTCSDKFAQAVAAQLGLGYKPDSTGLFTDVHVYADKIPECTNISVGYQNEHGAREIINAGWLINQLIPTLYEVKWEELPVERDHKRENFHSSHYVASRHSIRNFDDYGYSSYSGGWGNHGNERQLPYSSGNYESFVSKNVKSTSSFLTCDICFCADTNLEEHMIDENNYQLCSSCAHFLEEENIELAKMMDEENQASEKKEEVEISTEELEDDEDKLYNSMLVQ